MFAGNDVDVPAYLEAGLMTSSGVPEDRLPNIQNLI